MNAFRSSVSACCVFSKLSGLRVHASTFTEGLWQMIQGISHITFIVSDLDRMTDLLRTVFGAKEVYSSGEKTFSISKEKFFLLNGLWIAIMEGMPLSERTYNHVAFQIREEDLDEIARRIKSLGLEVREARNRIDGEGQSLYFYDFDNHLFELHTGTLDQRLKSYSQANKNDSPRA